MQQCPLNSILVVDEAPLIAVGLQEVFRSLHPFITVEHIGNIYTALSAPGLSGRVFDLVILGELIKAYDRLGAEERYISGMFHTLFYDFQFDNSSNSS